ncbi:peptidoglycan-binding protein [Kitasatospora sp. NPDC057223]|uniref:peptidoglycan-binding protein n=1 Tax=Kitasatospora sp. NPDC057223 TaxID=3346055 RepID=UPI00363E0C01
MPDQHCPVCGTVRTAGGCGCSPDLTDTTVLPHIEGPPLVRPYVPQAVGRPGQQAQAAPPPPDYDAFPPAVYATALMPPVPPAAPHPVAPHQAAPHQAAPHQAAPVQSAPDELGLFAFDNSPDPDPAHTVGPGRGRAARRAEQRGPLTRRRGAMLAAGAGVVLLGVGAALLTAPSDGGEKTALPVPSLTSTPTVNAPTDPPSSAEPSPDAEATAASASPSPARTSRAPASRPPTAAAPAPVTAAPAPAVPAAPTTTQAAPPAPPSAPAATSAPATPSPGPSATPATLRRDAVNDPAEVKAMQVKLVAVSCGTVDKSIESGTFDWWTQWVLSNYQKQHKITKSEDGIYGPATRAVLEADKPAC